MSKKSQETGQPTTREMKVLAGLCLGTVEDEAHFPNVGRQTLGAMLAKGWIEHATCEIYETVGYRITALGQSAHEIGFDAGF